MVGLSYTQNTSSAYMEKTATKGYCCRWRCGKKLEYSRAWQRHARDLKSIGASKPKRCEIRQRLLFEFITVRLHNTVSVVLTVNVCLYWCTRSVYSPGWRCRTLLMAKFHFTQNLDSADAAEVARCVVPLQEPADVTAQLLLLTQAYTSAMLHVFGPGARSSLQDIIDVPTPCL